MRFVVANLAISEIDRLSLVRRQIIDHRFPVYRMHLA